MQGRGARPQGRPRPRPRRGEGPAGGEPDGHRRRPRRRRARTPARSTLDDAMFGIEPNVPVMHQVVTAQLAARRSGTQSTKTRAEVRGGGAKPWRQKGTGRARQGSIRSPQWRGGGVALGPKPRSYAQRTPKKMMRLALRSALSDRAADGKVAGRRRWGFDAPKTQGRRRRARPRSASRAGSLRRAAAPTTRPPGRASATSSDVHILDARRAQRLRRARHRLGHLHRRPRCREPTASRRGRASRRRDRRRAG